MYSSAFNIYASRSSIILLLLLSACNQTDSEDDKVVDEQVNSANELQDEENLETEEATRQPATEPPESIDEVGGTEPEPEPEPESTPVTAHEEQDAPAIQEDVAAARNYQTPDTVEQCSVEDIKRRVDFDMRDYYIYYDKVPVLDLDSFDTAEMLMEALRVDPDIYSNVQDAATHTSLTAEGTRSGYGFWFLPTTDNTVRFRESRLGSPADVAGIRRGDELIEFNGEPIEQVSNQQVQNAYADQSAAIEMLIRTGDNTPRAVSVTYQTYQWQTAGRVKRFPVSAEDGRLTVGYIQIRQFIATTHNEIVSSLNELRENGGVEELIVDLRYNPGGITWIARHLASVIGGEAVAEQIFVRYTTNDKYEEESELFDTVSDPLNLPRVIVLATSRSASASEAFINSLEPFIDVVVIGELTNGKPYSSFILPYCGKTINAMNLLRTNSSGVSVLGGIHPDCYVEDDWQLASNNANDPLTAEALHYITSNACSTPVQRGLSSRARSTEDTLYSVPESLTTFSGGRTNQ